MYKLIEYIINDIRLIQNLTCVLRAYRICNSIVRFSKYLIIFISLSKVVGKDYNQFCN